MPSRVFNHFDMINIVEGYTSGPTDVNLVTSIASSRFGAFNLSGSGNDASSSGSAVSSRATYQQQGDVDFTRFPGVPKTAIITKLRIRTSSFVSSSLSANTGRENTCSTMVIATAGGLSVSEIDVETGPPGNLGILNVNASLYISELLSGPAADQVIDFSSSPIDFDTLVASYGTVILSIDEWIVTTANASVGGNNASATFTVGFSEYEIEVTWTEKYQFTIIPSLVRSGDTVTVTGGVDFTHTDNTTITYRDTDGTVRSIPVDDIIEKTETSLEFVVPVFLLDFPLGFPAEVGVYIDGDGTQFSGSILLGMLNVYIVDSSGIYVLDEDQTSDLLYFRLGYSTDVNLLMLPDDSYDNDDFSELLQYSSGIFLQDNTDEEEDDFLVTSILLTPFVLLSTKIPSPFAKTAFLP